MIIIMAAKDHETITIRDQVGQNSAEVERQISINKANAFEKSIRQPYIPKTGNAPKTWSISCSKTKMAKPKNK